MYTESTMVEGVPNRQPDNVGKQTRYLRFVVTFISYFATAEGSRYVTQHFHALPAVLWPPVGIAFGALTIWGYGQWIPIALAQLCFVFIAPTAPVAIASAVASVVGYTTQSVLGAYAFKKLKFDGAIVRTRDALSLIGVAFIFTSIAPIIVSTVSYLYGTLQVSFWINWTRAWAGGAFSTLIITPFITSWSSKFPRSQGTTYKIKRIETISAMGAVLAITYLLFWTTFAGANSFLFIYVFLGVFFWVGLRLQPRVMTLALALAASFGILGTLLTHPIGPTLGSQLFADELFIVLLSPIFLILSVLVTERRVAIALLEKETRELEQAMERLAEQDRSRNDFITILGHELRNPLAPIASTLEYLRMKETDPENLKAVATAEQQVRIVRRLLDDLLDTHRIIQKKFKLQKEDTTLEAVLLPAIDSVNQFFASKEHHFSYKIPRETIHLNADPIRITQSVMNLLFNAGKYTPPGGTIELVAKVDGDSVLISVTDNGHGISRETFSFIFEPFQQAPRDATVGTGLGLGLYITKQLIEMHGGMITAESEGVNKGSTFTIRLPLAQAGLHIREVSPQEKHRDAASERNFNIIVVDDNEAAAMALQKLLTLRGHVTRTAYDGKTAIREIGKFKPDIIILDIGLPDMSGHDIARQLRTQNTPAVLIALTGYGQDHDRIEAKKSGFDYHLTKPIALTDLEKIFDSI
jgi:signal transduction histidine kinase